MSSFAETKVIPPASTAHHTRPHEQTSHRQVDARRDRRAEAARRVRARTSGRS